MRVTREILDWVLVIAEIGGIFFLGSVVRRLTDLLPSQVRPWGPLLIFAMFIALVIVADRVLRAWLKKQTWWGDDDSSKGSE